MCVRHYAERGRGRNVSSQGSYSVVNLHCLLLSLTLNDSYYPNDCVSYLEVHSFEQSLTTEMT